MVLCPPLQPHCLHPPPSPFWLQQQNCVTLKWLTSLPDFCLEGCTHLTSVGSSLTPGLVIALSWTFPGFLSRRILCPSGFPASLLPCLLGSPTWLCHHCPLVCVLPERATGSLALQWAPRKLGISIWKEPAPGTMPTRLFSNYMPWASCVTSVSLRL